MVNEALARRPRRVRKSVVRHSAMILAAVVVGSGATAVMSAGTANADSPAQAGQFVAIAPATVVKTADGVGWSGAIQPGATKDVAVTGVNAPAGMPGTGVSAVMLKVATWGASSTDADNGSLWVYPTGGTRGYGVVNNAPSGNTADNVAIVAIGTGGQLSFYDGPNASSVNVRADVIGYVASSGADASGSNFVPISPTRILDTRNPQGIRTTPLTAAEGSWSGLSVVGAGGVPTSNVSAVALNIGATGASSNCWVQAQPTNTSTSVPAYPRVNVDAGYTAQQFAMVAPGPDGNLTLTTNCASVDVFIDVEGYYTISGAGEIYIPLDTPNRVVDTRSNIGIAGAMTAGRTVKGAAAVSTAGVGAIPSSADAVVLSAHALNSTTNGRDTIWTDGEIQPSGSSIDGEPDLVEDNLLIVSTGPNNAMDVAAASTDSKFSNDLLIDIEGYFVSNPSATIQTTNFTVGDGDGMTVSGGNGDTKQTWLAANPDASPDTDPLGGTSTNGISQVDSSSSTDTDGLVTDSVHACDGSNAGDCIIHSKGNTKMAGSHSTTNGQSRAILSGVPVVGNEYVNFVQSKNTVAWWGTSPVNAKYLDASMTWGVTGIDVSITLPPGAAFSEGDHNVTWDPNGVSNNWIYRIHRDKHVHFSSPTWTIFEDHFHADGYVTIGTNTYDIVGN